MRWMLALRLVVSSLLRGWARTVLSASSLSVGLAAVVLLGSFGAGAERKFQRALEGLGQNLLVVAAARTEVDALRGASREVETLTVEDWRSVAREVEGVARAVPLSLESVRARNGARAVETTVFATTPGFQVVKNQIMAAGRFLEAADEEERARVAVLGDHLVEELFRGEVPLGERILLDGVPFLIVGVLARKGADPTGEDEDDRIVIPLSAGQRRLFGVDHLDRIFVQTERRDQMEVTRRGLQELLGRRHLSRLGRGDFTIRDQTAILEALSATDRVFEKWLAGLAASTLGLGAVGLFASAQLSVRSRHTEIGVRLAVGSRPRHIVVQFLVESIVVALLGAVMGSVLGGMGVVVGERWFGWQVAIDFGVVLRPFLLALLLGAVSACGPAWQAARLDPILALRGR